MKKFILTTLMLASITTPAFADHHKGEHHKKYRQNHHAAKYHTPTAEMIMAHASMRQQRMQELLSTGEMAVSLMRLAHQQMKVALDKKDHSQVEKALDTFQAARHLHKPNMKMMKKMSEHLLSHVSDVESGKIKLTPEQASAFKKEVTLFTQQVKAFQADCQENIRPLNQAMRKNALDFLMMDFNAAKKANQSEKMVHIAKIMKKLPPFKGH